MNIQIQYTHSESNGESLDISQVQRTASPWVLICQPTRQLCILLCRLTFIINSPFTSFADNLQPSTIILKTVNRRFYKTLYLYSLLLKLYIKNNL
nr:MAG TPA: hypothetical protein [Caudoviricetes sp.]